MSFGGDHQCNRLEQPDERTAPFWPVRASVWVRQWWEQRFLEYYPGETKDMVDASKYYEGKGEYLSADDLKKGAGYQEVSVRIEETWVEEHLKNDAGEPDPKISLKFMGKQKRLILNKVNFSIISGAWGNETSNWLNKDLILWVDPGVHFKGQVVPGLRVRIATPTEESEIPF